MTMPRLRISLAGSLGIIAVIAMGLAGMVSASSLWTTAAATVTLALLLTGLLAARLLDGIDRAVWAGFALFGWSYLILVNWDWVGGQLGHDLTAPLTDLADFAIPGPGPPPVPLFTQNPFVKADRAIANPTATLSVSIPKLPGPPYLDLVRERQIKLGNFVQIARMFLSLAFGLLGGWIAQALARRRDSTANFAGSPGSDPAGRGVG
jgi:hypothetical protein